MKKTASIIIALALCMVFVFTGCGKNKATPGQDIKKNTEFMTDANLTGDVHQAIDVAEGAAQEVQESAVPKVGDIEIFESNKFYLEGTIYTSAAKEGMNVNIAMDGRDKIQMTTTMSGLYLGIFHDTDKDYVVNPGNNTYLELSESVMKVMGLDQSMVDFDFDAAVDSDLTMKYYNVDINGQTGLCTEATGKDGNVTRLYSVGDKLVQIDSIEADGTISSRIVVSLLSGTIPSNQLTLNGLTKSSSMVSFFKGMVTE